jgi:SAM-dependent methyltransferase
VEEHHRAIKDRTPVIWDCGCGYATTQIFLALNGFSSIGNTLEFYFKEIPQRLDYWKQYGDMDKVVVRYQDVFEKEIMPQSADSVIVQDTLHHLEPLHKSLEIFERTIRNGGMIIAIEENGGNLIQRFKLYLRRGNRRIIEYYDEGLQRMVKMGNENIRPWHMWVKEFEDAGLQPDLHSRQYIRLFPPIFYQVFSDETIGKWEQNLWVKSSLLRNCFYFGINFVVRKP